MLLRRHVERRPRQRPCPPRRRHRRQGGQRRVRRHQRHGEPGSTPRRPTPSPATASRSAAPTAPTSSTPTCSTWPPRSPSAPRSAPARSSVPSARPATPACPTSTSRSTRWAGRRSTPTPSSRRSAPARRTGCSSTSSSTRPATPGRCCATPRWPPSRRASPERGCTTTSPVGRSTVTTCSRRSPCSGRSPPRPRGSSWARWSPTWPTASPPCSPSPLPRLDAISGRRVLLGIGAGTAPGTKWAAEMDAVGQAVATPLAARHARVAETLDVLHEVLDLDRRDELATFPVVAHRPLVVIGLNSVPLATLAGQRADGINVRVGPPTPRRAVRRRPRRPRRPSRVLPHHVDPLGRARARSRTPTATGDGRAWHRPAGAGRARDRGPGPRRRRRAGTVRAMDDDVIASIGALVDEEHRLHAKAGPGEPLTEDDEARLRDLEVRLDQCWDLLRQRAGPPGVRPRPRRRLGALGRRRRALPAVADPRHPGVHLASLELAERTRPGEPSLRAGTAPKEQPPRNLSGVRTGRARRRWKAARSTDRARRRGKPGNGAG